MKVEEYVPCLLLAMLTDDQAKGSDPASKWVLFTDRRQNLLVQEQWCYYFHTCVLWIDLSENSGVSIFILVYSESLSPLKGSLLYKGFELLIRSFCLNLSVFHLALLWEVYCRACVASGGDSSKTSDWPGLQWAVRWNGKYATKAHFCLFNLDFWVKMFCTGVYNDFSHNSWFLAGFLFMCTFLAMMRRLTIWMTAMCGRWWGL